MTWIEFEQLPAGVHPLRDYPSLGATLVECDHAAENRHHLVGVDLGTMRADGYSAEVCSICKATDFSRPVKLLAVVPGAAEGALF